MYIVSTSHIDPATTYFSFSRTNFRSTSFLSLLEFLTLSISSFDNGGGKTLSSYHPHPRDVGLTWLCTQEIIYLASLSPARELRHCQHILLGMVRFYGTEGLG
jgi:hypothetical protein